MDFDAALNPPKDENGKFLYGDVVADTLGRVADLGAELGIATSDQKALLLAWSRQAAVGSAPSSLNGHKQHPMWGLINDHAAWAALIPARRETTSGQSLDVIRLVLLVALLRRASGAADVLRVSDGRLTIAGRLTRPDAERMATVLRVVSELRAQLADPNSEIDVRLDGTTVSSKNSPDADRIDYWLMLYSICSVRFIREPRLRQRGRVPATPNVTCREKTRTNLSCNSFRALETPAKLIAICPDKTLPSRESGTRVPSFRTRRRGRRRLNPVGQPSTTPTHFCAANASQGATGC